MSRPVRVDFSDFWPTFDRHDNFFTQLLRQRFDVQVVDDPDFLIHSCFGKRCRRFYGIRIYFTGENIRPDFCLSDYAFTFDYLDRPEHYRLPLYVLSVPAELLMLPRRSPEEILASKTRFCGFVVSNGKCKRRNEFFHKLSRYKRVDSGGIYENNVGGPVRDKLQFQRQHKFTLAFENCSYPGYTTEKLPQCIASESVPAYWGNPLVAREFNPARFLDYLDYGSDEALIERIIELDNDDEKYLEYLRQPFFYDNRPNEYYDAERLLDHFEWIFSNEKVPAACSWPKFVGFQTKRLGRNLRQALRNVA